jgi:hypothetical protein
LSPEAEVDGSIPEVEVDGLSPEAEADGGLLTLSRRALVIYETFMTSACFCCLGALTLWHAQFIHLGQTSIEVGETKVHCWESGSAGSACFLQCW